MLHDGGALTTKSVCLNVDLQLGGLRTAIAGSHPCGFFQTAGTMIDQEDAIENNNNNDNSDNIPPQVLRVSHKSRAGGPGPSADAVRRWRCTRSARRDLNWNIVFFVAPFSILFVYYYWFFS